MGKRLPAVDAYIAAAAPAVRPILAHLRKLMHRACPGVVEVIKWNVPHFEHQGLLAGMGGFKAHAGFGFWRGKDLPGFAALCGQPRGGSMCSLKLTSVEAMPPDAAMLAVITDAVRLNEKLAAAPKSARPAPRRKVRPPRVPPDLAAGLAGNRRAAATYAGFPPSHQREYVEWILEAKRAETRARRVEQAVAQMAEGKSRHWKYRQPRS